MYQKIKKSGKSLLAIIVVLLMITLTACTNKNSSANKDKSAKAGKEMTLKYSKGFSIKYIDDGIKKVTDGQKFSI